MFLYIVSAFPLGVLGLLHGSLLVSFFTYAICRRLKRATPQCASLLTDWHAGVRLCPRYSLSWKEWKFLLIFLPPVDYLKSTGGKILIPYFLQMYPLWAAWLSSGLLFHVA